MDEHEVHARKDRADGATVLDEPCVVDGNLITSRRPDDIPAFTREMVRLFARQEVGTPR